MREMKKRTVYIETTVVSYYTAHSSRDIVVAAYQEVTRQIWPRLATRYESFISTLVHKEVSRGT